MAQGYTQVEGVDFDETFVPIARLESIRLLLGMSCYLKFKHYQIDVKSAFLNGVLLENAYVEQPTRFEDPFHPDHVYKLKKALYGLKQAPLDWYERLTIFLISHGFNRGIIDKTLFIKALNPSIVCAQIYVGDIVFGSTSPPHSQEFISLMPSEF